MNSQIDGHRIHGSQFPWREGAFILVALIPFLCRPTSLSAAAFCGDRLAEVRPSRGESGTVITLVGQWEEPRGAQQAVINRNGKNLLDIQSWSATEIKARVPQSMKPGLYRVGVYCADPQYEKVGSSGFLDFEVTAPGDLQGSGVAMQTTSVGILGFQVVQETNEQVTFEVEYNYDIPPGRLIGLGIAGLKNGAYTGHFGYGRVPMPSGHQKVKNFLHYLDTSPPSFVTDEVEFQLYWSGGAPFITRRFPFRKTWSQNAPGRGARRP